MFKIIVWLAMYQGKMTSCTNTTDAVNSYPNLAAVFFNSISGKGIFEPYNAIETFMMEWAMYATCSLSHTNDTTLANDMMTRLLPPTSQ